MSRPPGSGPWLTPLALCAVIAPVPAAAETRVALVPAQVDDLAADLASLIPELDAWLDPHLPWPRRDAPPSIRLVNSMEALRLGGKPTPGHGRARGLYDPDTATIYLVTPWSADNPQDMAVLLHELVHHRQAPHHFYCPEQQEVAAYRAQELWLAERGLDADINWFAVILAAGCTPRDIHPD